jgi:hypothetical protein
MENTPSENTVEIKQMIKDYMKISNELDEFNKETKNLRNQKKMLEDTIQNYMINQNIGRIDVPGNGVLKVKKTKTPLKLGKRQILECLLLLVEEEKSELIIDQLFDGDSEIEKTSLEFKKGK